MIRRVCVLAAIAAGSLVTMMVTDAGATNGAHFVEEELSATLFAADDSGVGDDLLLHFKEVGVGSGATSIHVTVDRSVTYKCGDISMAGRLVANAGGEQPSPSEDSLDSSVTAFTTMRGSLALTAEFVAAEADPDGSGTTTAARRGWVVGDIVVTTDRSEFCGDELPVLQYEVTYSNIQIADLTNGVEPTHVTLPDDADTYAAESAWPDAVDFQSQAGCDLDGSYAGGAVADVDVDGDPTAVEDPTAAVWAEASAGEEALIGVDCVPPDASPEIDQF